VPSSREFVAVVSGVPRSGTSLAMHMLQAGGIPPLTDGLRQPDQHNPHGYFEYEPVKRLAQDSSWVPVLAPGRALKVIYRLLPHLPSTVDYRVLFMERDWREVFRSQQSMLLARNDAAADQPEARLVAAISAEVRAVKDWAESQSNIRLLPVPYGAAVAEPLYWARAISGFLGGGLDIEAMAAVADPQLYRHRASK
jgi:hypothetical protein